jgi:hypothetical protein
MRIIVVISIKLMFLQDKIILEALQCSTIRVHLRFRGQEYMIDQLRI